jgi:hypothetical protein
VLLTSGKLTTLIKEVYNQWKNYLEQEMVSRFRYSVRNQNDLDPVFHIDDIPKRRGQGGFGIESVHAPDLDATLRTYADETAFIALDMNSREFRLTDNGRTHIRVLDSEIPKE